VCVGCCGSIVYRQDSAGTPSRKYTSYYPRRPVAGVGGRNRVVAKAISIIHLPFLAFRRDFDFNGIQIYFI